MFTVSIILAAVLPSASAMKPANKQRLAVGGPDLPANATTHTTVDAEFQIETRRRRNDILPLRKSDRDQGSALVFPTRRDLERYRMEERASALARRVRPMQTAAICLEDRKRVMLTTPVGAPVPEKVKDRECRAVKLIGWAYREDSDGKTPGKEEECEYFTIEHFDTVMYLALHDKSGEPHLTFIVPPARERQLEYKEDRSTNGVYTLTIFGFESSGGMHSADISMKLYFRSKEDRAEFQRKVKAGSFW